MKISCDMFQDLMPLVRDGVAGEDSVRAVKEHREECEHCRAMFDGELPPVVSVEPSLRKFRKKLRLLGAAVLGLLLIFIFSQSMEEWILLNLFLMPLFGALGYVVLGEGAIWIVPVFSFAVYGAIHLSELLREPADTGVAAYFGLCALYSACSILGMWLARLYASVKKPVKHGWFRWLKLSAAILFTALYCFFANQQVGNPVSFLLAKHTARSYAEKNFKGEPLTLKQVEYNRNIGCYCAYFREEGNPKRQVTVHINMFGKAEGDSR